MITITTETLSDFFTKHHIKGLQIEASINVFTAADTGDPHDHPFDFTTYILSGGYVERVYTAQGYADVERLPETLHTVMATDVHQIIKLPTSHCITLMVPKSGHIRKPGFYRFIDGVVWHRFWDEGEFKIMEI